MPSLASTGAAAWPVPSTAAPTASAFPCLCIARLSLPFIPLPPFLFPSLCSHFPAAEPRLLWKRDTGTSRSSALAFGAGSPTGPQCPLRWGKTRRNLFPGLPSSSLGHVFPTPPPFCLAGSPLALGGFGAIGTAWPHKVAFCFAEAA